MSGKVVLDTTGNVMGDTAVPVELASLNGSPPEPLVYDHTINGKAVHLKRVVPLKDGHRLIALLQAVASNDMDDQVAICCVMIESWDFPGDPSQPESYAALDIFDEVLPLSAAVLGHVQARTNRMTAKNSVGASI